MNAKAHLVAYFNDDSLAQLLKAHSESAECLPSVSAEMLAKSAFDPGSSRLHHSLLSVQAGETQFSMECPKGLVGLAYSDALTQLKDTNNALLIAIAMDNSTDIKVNPEADYILQSNDRLFYIASSRVHVK